MSTDARHPDPVALVAGRVDPEDASRIAAHLAVCEECRSEAARLRSLRDSLRRAADGGHPSEAVLVDYDESGATIDLVARAAIEAHLERCPGCRDDLAALGGARRARGSGSWSGSVVRPAGAPRGSRRRLVAAAVAIVVVGAVTAIATWRGGPRQGGSPEGPSAAPVTFMPPKRGGAEDRRLPADARVSLRVVLPVGAPEGLYRVRVEREDGVAEGGPIGSGPARDEVVMVDLVTPSRSGAYRLVLDRAGVAPGERYLYPFRVDPAPGNRRRDGS